MNEPILSDRRLWLTDDDTIVDDGDVRGVKLLVGAGGQVPPKYHDQYEPETTGTESAKGAESAPVTDAAESEAASQTGKPETATIVKPKNIR